MRRWVLTILLAVSVGAGVHAQTAASEAVGEQRVHARRQVSIFEGVIETAVTQGAEELIGRARSILANDLLLLTGTARARGVRLAEYGVFVDVAVPALRQSLVWSLRTMASDQAVARAAFDQLRAHVASIQDAAAKPRLEKALRSLEPQAGPGDTRSATGSGPGARGTPVMAADAAWLEDPSEAYTAEVRRAIVDAILDHSGSLELGPTERLTVAARDFERADRAAPGSQLSVLTLTVRGGDLAAFRAGAISREEALARIQVEEQCVLVFNALMRHLVFCVVLGASLLVGCGRNIDVEHALEIADVSSGWYDAGLMEDGKNKLVPSIALKLKNVSDAPVSGVQINAIFRRIGDEDAWGEHFVRAIGQAGLEPGATGGDIVLRSNLGYTGEQARAQMLQNHEFVDAMVNIFAKQGSQTWVKIGEYQIDRKLLTR